MDLTSTWDPFSQQENDKVEHEQAETEHDEHEQDNYEDKNRRAECHSSDNFPGQIKFLMIRK